MKTPIQEFVDLLESKVIIAREQESNLFLNAVDMFEIRDKYVYLLQKEKAFAFDCFEAGRLHEFDTTMCSKFSEETTFEQFYSKYTEQHNK